MDWLTSSHRNHWLFDAASVKKERLESLRRVFIWADEATLEGHLTDQQLVLQFTMRNLQLFARRISLWRSTEATALMFFKRYCLHHSVFESDKLNRFMFSCVYLATKVTEQYIPAPQFVQYVLESTGEELSAEELLGNEVSLLEALKFQLLVYDPRTTLTVALEELAMAMPQSADFPALQNYAERQIDFSWLTDLPLTARPQLIALAAYTLACTYFKISENIWSSIPLYQHATETDSSALQLVTTTLAAFSAAPTSAIAAAEKRIRRHRTQPNAAPGDADKENHIPDTSAVPSPAKKEQVASQKKRKKSETAKSNSRHQRFSRAVLENIFHCLGDFGFIRRCCEVSTFWSEVASASSWQHWSAKPCSTVRLIKQLALARQANSRLLRAEGFCFTEDVVKVFYEHITAASTLTVIHISNCPSVTSGTLEQIFVAAPPSLTKVLITDTLIDAEGSLDFVSFIPESVVSLCLDGVGLSQTSGLISSLQQGIGSSLRLLSVASNPLHSAVIPLTGAAAGFSSLSHLNLSNTGLADGELALVLRSLSTVPQLKVLRIGNDLARAPANIFGAESHNSLPSLLGQVPLTGLDLSGLTIEPQLWPTIFSAKVTLTVLGVAWAASVPNFPISALLLISRDRVTPPAARVRQVNSWAELSAAMEV